MVWVIVRTMYKGVQIVPAWSGFLSQTGKKPQQIIVIDYYPVIPNHITEYKTECLECAEQATDDVGQKYIVTSFDLGVCMKAYSLV